MGTVTETIIIMAQPTASARIDGEVTMGTVSYFLDFLVPLTCLQVTFLSWVHFYVWLVTNERTNYVSSFHW